MLKKVRCFYGEVHEQEVSHLEEIYHRFRPPYPPNSRIGSPQIAALSSSHGPDDGALVPRLLRPYHLPVHEEDMPSSLCTIGVCP
jgi:hypothetical protein